MSFDLILVALVLGLGLAHLLERAASRIPQILERQWARDLALANGVEAGVEAGAGAVTDAADPRAGISGIKIPPPLGLGHLLSGQICAHCQHVQSGSGGWTVMGFTIMKPVAQCEKCAQPLAGSHGVGQSSRLWPRLWRAGLDVAMVVICAVLIARMAHPILSALWIGIFALMLVLSWIDMEHMLLPDWGTYAMLWAGLGWAVVAPHVLPDHIVVNQLSPGGSILGAIAGYLLLAVPAGAYSWWRGFDGMGMGDFKYLAAIGAWVGPWALIAVLLVASFSSLLVAGLSMWTKLSGQRQFPFGPHLTLGAVLTVLDPGGWTSRLGLPHIPSLI